jgi:hypothetical protein
VTPASSSGLGSDQLAEQGGTDRSVAYIGLMKTSSLEILENAELPSAQAHAILKVMESEMASAHETLATKTDLLAVRADLNAGMANLREQILVLEVKMNGIEGRLTRWVFTCILGQTAVLVGFGYFMLGHAGK